MSDFGLFEHLAYEGNEERDARRIAHVRAHARAEDQFLSFLDASAHAEERKWRAAYIDDDLREVVADACEESGVTLESEALAIYASVAERLGKGAFCDDCRKWNDGCTCGKDDKKTVGDEPADDDKDEPDENESQKKKDKDDVSKSDFFEEIGESKESRHQGPFDRTARRRHQEGPCPDCGAEDGHTSDCEQGEDAGDAGSASTANVRHARRPKLCPYHSEVVDISLASGDPLAGFNAMAQHAWGAHHCKGEFDGSCNFRRQMVTQQYWDGKQQEYADRARERAERAEQSVPAEMAETVEAPDVALDPAEGPDLSESLSEAPSAVGTGESMPEASMAMAAGRTAEVGFGWHVAAPENGDSAEKREKVLQDEGPSPKIDHKKWKPNALNPDGNLPEIKAEGEGSPHPTERQDPVEVPEYKTFNTPEVPGQIEEQDVTKGDEHATPTEAIHTDTWSDDGGQVDPVTTEVQSNRLTDFLAADFTPAVTAQAAIAAFEGR